MPYETDLDTAFTILLGKAQGTGVVAPAPTPVPISTPVVASGYSIIFPFTGGGGAAVTTAGVQPLVIEVPDPGEIVWAHMYAGDADAQPVAVTATIELHITRYDTFAGRTPVYGSGSPPQLVAASQSNASLTGWFPHFDNGAVLIARLTTFSGTATWVSLLLKVRRDYTVQNQLAVLDASGNEVLDAFGNPVVYST